LGGNVVLKMKNGAMRLYLQVAVMVLVVALCATGSIVVAAGSSFYKYFPAVIVTVECALESMQ
jgi:hypothetical protein